MFHWKVQKFRQFHRINAPLNRRLYCTTMLDHTIQRELWIDEKDTIKRTKKKNNHNLFIGVEHISMGCSPCRFVCLFFPPLCVYPFRCTHFPWHTISNVLCICFVCLLLFFFFCGPKCRCTSQSLLQCMIYYKCFVPL